MSLLHYLLPYRKLTIESSLTPDEVCDRLARDLPRRHHITDWFKLSGFRGKASPRAFWFRRNIAYRNSFVPIVTGTIHPETKGSRINVTMRPSFWVLALILAMCIFSFVAAVQSSDAATLVIVPVFVATMNLAFSWEATKATHYLDEAVGTVGYV